MLDRSRTRSLEGEPSASSRQTKAVGTSLSRMYMNVLPSPSTRKCAIVVDKGVAAAPRDTEVITRCIRAETEWVFGLSVRHPLQQAPYEVKVKVLAEPSIWSALEVPVKLDQPWPTYHTCAVSFDVLSRHKLYSPDLWPG